jgi:hypothetical protein
MRVRQNAQALPAGERRPTLPEAERAYLPGRAVRERRLALGLSQVELATEPA